MLRWIFLSLAGVAFVIAIPVTAQDNVAVGYALFSSAFTLAILAAFLHELYAIRQAIEKHAKVTDRIARDVHWDTLQEVTKLRKSIQEDAYPVLSHLIDMVEQVSSKRRDG